MFAASSPAFEGCGRAPVEDPKAGAEGCPNALGADVVAWLPKAAGRAG